MYSNIDPPLTLVYDGWNKVSMRSINKASIKQVILKEFPGGIFLSCGGKTALDCCVELYESSFLEEYSRNVLG